MRWLWIIAHAASTSESTSPPACDVAACAAEGKLCDGDACVDPWRHGSLVFSRCEGEPRATAESLAQKAAVYDRRAIALHTHPQMPWIVDVVLKPGVDPETATSADVEVWWSGENDGLFSGLAMAAQAYRYAVTKSPEARAALATLLAGERMRMEITGVPGLFTRQLIPPGIAGLACPTGRANIQGAFERELARPAATTRGILAQHNAWWQIMWAAQKPLGPGTDGPAFAAVEDAVCQLRQFPRSNHVVARDLAALAPGVCLDRQDNSLAAAPFEIADRCAATFAYWGNPYERNMCDAWPALVHQPGGYLLPYWMGRFNGFIDADL